nr:hypothetical protein [Tanacetum cinerariifolium]
LFNDHLRKINIEMYYVELELRACRNTVQYKAHYITTHKPITYAKTFALKIWRYYLYETKGKHSGRRPKQKVKIKAFASKSLRNVGSEEFNISYTGSLMGSNEGRNLKEEALSSANEKLETGADGIKYLNRRAWIPKVNNLRKVVMDEAHRSRYSIHPGADKMYMDVKESYWWAGMKRDIAIYVRKCLT